MEALAFDIQNGIYLTQVHSIQSDLHSHPAIEFIAIENGAFSLEVEGQVHHGLAFAAIDANVPHKVTLDNADAMILLVEYRNAFLSRFLETRGVRFRQGHFVSRHDSGATLIREILAEILAISSLDTYDPRVQQVLDYLKQHATTYFDLKREVHRIVHLSESRLSHLFKAQVGISMKRYLVWSNLRMTVSEHLRDHKSLMDVLLIHGFYDQPHFNRSFKSFVGTRPATTYKSRIVQGKPTDGA